MNHRYKSDDATDQRAKLRRASSFKRILLTALLSLGLLVPWQLTNAQAADTQAVCSGELIEHHVVEDPHEDIRLGAIKVYHDDGHNCAVTRVRKAIREKRTLVHVFIGECSSGDPDGPCGGPDLIDTAADRGYFDKYAGPVRVYAPGHCIRVSGTIETDDGLYGWRSLAPYHCG